MLGATVVPVISGNMTLKDATNEAIRDWCSHPEDTHYVIWIDHWSSSLSRYGSPIAVGYQQRD